MSQLTKNESARLRKVAGHLDTCLDALHRAAGEMYIPPLKLYRDDVQELIAATQETLDEVRRVLPPRRGPSVDRGAPIQHEKENGQEPDV